MGSVGGVIELPATSSAESAGKDRAYVVGVTVEKPDGDGSGTRLVSFPKPNGADGVVLALGAGRSFVTNGLKVNVDATSASTASTATSQVTGTLSDPDVVDPPPLRAQSGSVLVGGPPAVGQTVRAAPRSWTAGACYRSTTGRRSRPRARRRSRFPRRCSTAS